MQEPLRSIHYASASPADATECHRSALSFEATVATLKLGIQAQDLWLIHEINPQALAERGGYRIHPARQLLCFHPRYLAPLLERDPLALSEVPLKLVVMELPDGTVNVRHTDVPGIEARHPALHSLCGEWQALLARLVVSISADEAQRPPLSPLSPCTPAPGRPA